MAAPAGAKWPDPSDYSEVVQSPSLCFQDPGLKASQPRSNPSGLPHIITGNFAGVCEMRNGAQRWAIRCFLRQVSDQQRRYNIVSQHLGNLKPPMLVDFEYQLQGIRVRGQWYPIVKMEWVEGEPLSVFIERHIGNPAMLLSLAQQWRSLVVPLLRGLHVAHGDLQHGNVLVTPSGQIKLVDYDGMFVPPLRGEKSPELGHANYTHPKRTYDNYEEALDNFPALVIYLSLVGLANEPGLWQQFYTGENLILSAPDYKNPRQSAVLQRLKKNSDAQLRYLADCLERYCQGPIGQVPDLETVLLSAPSPASKPTHILMPTTPTSTPVQAQTPTQMPSTAPPTSTLPQTTPWWQNPPTPAQPSPSVHVSAQAGIPASSAASTSAKKPNVLVKVLSAVLAVVAIIWVLKGFQQPAQIEVERLRAHKAQVEREAIEAQQRADEARSKAEAEAKRQDQERQEREARGRLATEEAERKSRQEIERLRAQKAQAEREAAEAQRRADEARRKAEVEAQKKMQEEARLRETIPPTSAPRKQESLPTGTPRFSSDLTGTWRGTYHYPTPSNRPPVDFVATITTADGKTFSGRISETNTFGNRTSDKLYADIKGRVGENGEVAFTKKYDGTAGVSHAVQYEGRLELSSSTIRGKWIIGGTAGSFQMTK